MLYISQRFDVKMAMVEMVAHLNKDQEHVKLDFVFNEINGNKQWAIVPLDFTPDDVRLVQWIEWDYVENEGFAQGAVQW